MHLDDALKVIGEFGRYQKTRLLLLCGFAVMSAWHALNMVFVGAEPRFHCSTDDVNTTRFNLSQSQLHELLIPADAQCYRLKPDEALPELLGNRSSVNLTEIGRESCPAGYVYYTDQYDSTITSDFELVCGRKFWRSTSKSVFFAGRLVGAVIFGQLSDRFGRRPMFFVGVAMLVLAGGVASAAPSMLVFLPMYFLQGAAHTGAFLVSYTLHRAGGAQIPRHRWFRHPEFLQRGLHDAGWHCLLHPGLEVPGDSHHRPALLFVIYWWFLPESIRWLLSHNKEERARQVLTEASRSNGRQLPEELLKELQQDPAMKATRQYTLLDCLRTCGMAGLSFNVWFNWLVNALVYYGLSLNTENLAGSPYLNFCLAGAVEIPAYLLCILLLNRVGRRIPLIVTMYLGGIACILSGVIPSITKDLETLTIVLAMVGKFGITASYGIIYLAAAEVFPTVVRNIGMGVSSMSARIGGILAPLILETASVMPVLPMLIFGGLSVLAATLAFLLPETAGRPLPQLLEDVDTGRGCASSFCCGKSDKMEITADNAIPMKDGKKDHNRV